MVTFGAEEIPPFLFCRGLAWPDLHLARQGSWIHLEQIQYSLRDVGRLELPRIRLSWDIATEIRIHASRANITDLYVVLPDFLHKRFGKPVKTEL